MLKLYRQAEPECDFLKPKVWSSDLKLSGLSYSKTLVLNLWIGIGMELIT